MQQGGIGTDIGILDTRFWAAGVELLLLLTDSIEHSTLVYHLVETPLR